ncbi:MAG: hypothetical protein ACOYXY_12820 [Thermodesulfobacteriota bacterium]
MVRKLRTTFGQLTLGFLWQTISAWSPDATHVAFWAEKQYQ